MSAMAAANSLRRAARSVITDEMKTRWSPAHAANVAGSGAAAVPDRSNINAMQSFSTGPPSGPSGHGGGCPPRAGRQAAELLAASSGESPSRPVSTAVIWFIDFPLPWPGLDVRPNLGQRLPKAVPGLTNVLAEVAHARRAGSLLSLYLISSRATSRDSRMFWTCPVSRTDA